MKEKQAGIGGGRRALRGMTLVREASRKRGPGRKSLALQHDSKKKSPRPWGALEPK